MSPQYTDPINVLFDYVRLLAASDGITFLTLGNLEEKLRRGESFDPNEAQTWGNISRIVGQLDNETAQKALDELNRRYSATVASQTRATYHPFFQSGPRAEHLQLTAVDIFGEATSQQNPLVLVSQQPVALNMDDLSEMSWSAPFLTFRNEQRDWTVFLPEAKPSAEIMDTYVFDGALLTRIYLGDIGYFLGRRTLTFHDDIHFSNPAPLPISPEQKLIGFSSEAEGGGELPSLFAENGKVTGGEPEYDLNPVITAESARKIRDNFVKLGLTLKWAGIVMDQTDWLNMKFNPETGELFFGEDSRPFVFDSDFLSTTLDGHVWTDKVTALPDETIYVPDLRIYEDTSPAIVRSHEFLIAIITMLGEKIDGQPDEIFRDSVHAIAGMYMHQIREENETFADFINRYSEGIFKITEYYLKTIGKDGLVTFLTQIFAAVLISTKGDFTSLNTRTDEWLEKAKSYIDAAKKNAAGDFTTYWFRHYDELWGVAEVVVLKKPGGGRGGPAPQNTPEGGGEIEGGFSGGTTGLTKPAESTVSGLLIPDETTGGAFASRRIVRAAANTFNHGRLRRQNPAINTIRSGQRVFQRPALPVALRPARALTFSP